MISQRWLCVLVIFFSIQLSCFAQNMDIKLPPPSQDSELNLLIEKRQSCRNFKVKPLELKDLADILWASGGKKHDAEAGVTRTIPSAGATYALEFYVVVGKDSTGKLKEGVYHYLIDKHALQLVREGDRRNELAAACLGQDFIAEAPVSLAVTAIFNRTTNRYGERGVQYVYMEAGHACQNTYLAAESLGLGTVEVGAFIDNKVAQVLGLDAKEVPLIVMPLGYRE